MQEAQSDPLSFLIEMREYDVPYGMRAAIDLDLRVGAWHIVTPDHTLTTCEVVYQKDMLELCEPKVLAFDIECEKSPLKFPNAERDRIFMISYMTPGQGYLLINREVVSEDVADFEYTPMPKYPGPFTVINLADEEALLRKFISHIQELKPHVIVTYNGDFFDWPYVEARCAKYEGLNLYKNLGIKCVKGEGTNTTGSSNSATSGEYIGRCMVHLDAFSWVQRDSYLPQGNQGLKAVTKYKLGYDPVEVDPEDMVAFAKEKPDYMASYSVSDAVATYYLYQTYVHNFIFSLCTIIPLPSEDVLRKGSGTLCEALLMVEAFKGNIICPNKQNDPIENFAPNGHLLESETYIGGHVECLEAGVFRSDIPVKFNLIPSALSHLIERIDQDLAFACEVEHGIQRHEIANYDEVRQAIIEKLEMLRDRPNREEVPMIYHLDVGAMYPNIILTNRLQPSAIVSHRDCASCDYNRAENNCKREMTWTWRGEFNPASSAEYSSIRRQLSYEKLGDRTFAEYSEKEQAQLVKDRLKKYAHRVYKKTKVTSIEERTNTVCQRENAFYVNTVRAFRDRRYDYKLLTKTWKNKKNEAEKTGNAVMRKAAEEKEILMDSLQLAHKCILNSFYGYVMRKGARWRSMEMAGIVTHTGAQLIKQARELVEQVGRPLELDTDGIWCVLPASFPQDFQIQTIHGKSFHIGYPCAMLNADVHARYTNHQYQDLNPTTGNYRIHSECSIFFELDGPYHAMVLPASPEEDVLLKKKYVVFNYDQTIAELKGFEIKRRGELELVKIFQSQVFEQFLAGGSLEECYHSVGDIANQWLDVLDSKGLNIEDDELLELISEKKTISKTLDDYEGRKATSLTTAGRLADFLGAEMVKDKGLNCKLIIAKYPIGAPTTERAIPVAIFHTELATRQYFLRKWLKHPSLEAIDFREVVDWEYYKERLGKSIQKIVTIPAGMQRIANPVPRVEHPAWLQKRLQDQSVGLKQLTLKSMFSKPTLPAPKVTQGHHGNMSSPNRAASPPGRGRKLTSPLRPALSNVDTNSISRKRLLFPDMDDVKKIEVSPSRTNLIRTPDPIVLSPEEAVIPASNLSPDSNLQAWLKARHDQWKASRQLKKKSKNGSFRPEEIIHKRPVAVTDFVRNAALTMTYGHWQIIEIQQQDGAPGEFILWAMTSPTQLQKLKVVVPRVMYVNCAGIEAESAVLSLGGSKVVKELPHGRPCRSLYEVAVAEVGSCHRMSYCFAWLTLLLRLSQGKYQRSAKSMSFFLSDPAVEGVYETQVPLLLRIILHAGCVSQLSRDAQQNSLGTQQRAYKLQDLSFVHVNAHSYLDRHNNGKQGAIFKQIFVYHAVDKGRNSGRGAVALFIVDSHPQQEAPLSAVAYVWLSTGSNNQLLDNKPPFQRLYRRFQPDEAAASVKFSTTYTNSMSDALKACNERLTAYSRERHGPTIVVAQGGTDNRHWRRMLPALQDYPSAVLAGNTLDELFPALGWQMFIAERIVQRYLIFPRWFADRLHCARYSHVPVCNLGVDAITTMIDVSYARVLQQGRHLLWASETRVPDVGGEVADNAE
jgi:DNA polymerase epsilon subunit 1